MTTINKLFTRQKAQDMGIFAGYWLLLTPYVFDNFSSDKLIVLFLIYRFDEVHFGQFTNFFMNNKFFYDVNPPLGKLMFALAGNARHHSFFFYS